MHLPCCLFVEMDGSQTKKPLSSRSWLNLLSQTKSIWGFRTHVPPGDNISHRRCYGSWWQSPVVSIGQSTLNIASVLHFLSQYTSLPKRFVKVLSILIQIWPAFFLPMSFPRRYWNDRILLIIVLLTTSTPLPSNWKPGLPFLWRHGNPVPVWFDFGNPAVPVGPVAFPDYSIFEAVDSPLVTAGGVPRLLVVWLYRTFWIKNSCMILRSSNFGANNN